MISGISSSSSYYSSLSSTNSTTSTTTAAAAAKKFQEELFASLDTDGDGSVSSTELSTALSSSESSGDKGLSGILVSLSQNFSKLDSDSSSGLSLDELEAGTQPPTDGPGDSQMVDDLLASLDTNGDGSVSSDELSTAMSSAGSTTDSSKVFSALDTNKDGTISSDELAAAMAPPPPPPPVQDSSSTSSDALFSALDSDGNGSISASELSSAMSNDSSSSSDSSTQSETSAALSKLIASINREYQLDNSQSVGSQLTASA
jgi:Ca2+-binding EF-hand superfamily protein